MAYAVQADLNIDAQRLIEYTDNSGAQGVLDATLLAQLETQSEAIVNAVLGGSITMPITGTVPPIITFITASVWAYRICRHREVMVIPASIEDDYKLAWDLMNRIIAGEVAVDPTVPNLSGVPEVESSCARGWTPRDQVS